jgi:SAM-dependent methyltransferase
MNSPFQDYKNRNEEPFEWLTNFTSLAPYLDPRTLFSDSSSFHPFISSSSTSSTSSTRLDEDSDQCLKRVLHIGCGTSTLGIELHRTFPLCYKYVLNVDNDVEVIRQVSNRWNTLLQNYNRKNEKTTEDDTTLGTCCFDYMDLNDYHNINVEQDTSSTSEQHVENTSKNILPSPNNTFDLILDKSTLDCVLCSHNGTCGLLSCIHHHLKPGGVYFLVTFHHEDFILPLIRDCPGMKWKDIKYYTVERNVDSPQFVMSLEENLYQHDYDSLNLDRIWNGSKRCTADCQSTSPWASGTFEPDDDYREHVTVFICTRQDREQQDEYTPFLPLNGHLVANHVQDCNNQYFQQNNPLVTQMRQEDLRQKFYQELLIHSKQQLKNQEEDPMMDTMLSREEILPLSRVYNVLFTDYEREEYTFDDFVLDWKSFQESNNTGIHDDVGMCFETAIDFLKAMQ